MKISSIEDAMYLTAIVLWHGGAISIVKAALLSQGFAANKADIIIRWAQQLNKNNVTQNENI